MITAQELMFAYEKAQEELEEFVNANKDIWEAHQEKQKKVADLEAKLKNEIKVIRNNVEGDKFIAKYQVRHSASIINWHIEEIERQVWASAVIQKTIDQKTFEALAKIGKIENPESFKTEILGKEILAVSIVKKEAINE